MRRIKLCSVRVGGSCLGYFFLMLAVVLMAVALAYPN